MFGSTALEVGIGLALLFAMLSLIATSARELIEALLQTRAVHLERGIRELLKDPHGEELAKKIYDHPFISNLYRGTYDPSKQLTPTLWSKKDPWKRLSFRSNLPAYIPSRNFATALIDITARGTPNAYDAVDPALAPNRFKEAIGRLPNTDLRRALLIAFEDAQGDLEKARANIEKWFDSSMDRVSGWYRKQTQWILLGLGILIAVTLNVDALRIASALYHNDALRSAAVQQAESVSNDVQSEAGHAASLAVIGCQPITDSGDPEQAKVAASCARQRIADIGYPIGWDGRAIWRWSSVPGWLLTALAVSLGAPFWFDLLNKMMVIRSTVKPHEKSPEEASEDRQTRASPQSEGSKNEEHRTVDPIAKPPESDERQRGVTKTSNMQDGSFEPHEWKKGDPQEGKL